MTVLLIFLLGLVVGSFVNVFVHRTFKENSLARASACVHCHTSLEPRDLIPVVSYLLLRGKCRHCKSPISAHYPFIEFATGLLFALCYLRYATGFSWPTGFTENFGLVFFLRDLVLIWLLLVLFLCDLHYLTIPDRFTIPAIIGLGILNMWLGVPAQSLALGAMVLGLFFVAQYWLSRGTWIGGGDIRLA